MQKHITLHTGTKDDIKPMVVFVNSISALQEILNEDNTKGTNVILSGAGYGVFCREPIKEVLEKIQKAEST